MGVTGWGWPRRGNDGVDELGYLDRGTVQRQTGGGGQLEYIAHNVCSSELVHTCTRGVVCMPDLYELVLEYAYILLRKYTTSS